MDIIKITKENIDDYQAIWDSFIKRHKRGTFQHTMTYLKSRGVIGETIESFLLLQNDKIKAVIPLIKEKKFIFSRYKSAGFLTEGITFDDAFEIIKKYLAKNASHIEINSSECASQGSSENAIAYNYYLDIKGKSEKNLWEKYVDRKSRNLIRKAEKEGLKATISSKLEDLDKFYPIYVDRMKRFDKKPYKKEHFEFILNNHKDSFILNAFNDEEVVAGAFLIIFKKELQNPYAASKQSALNLSPNNFVYWEMIKFGLKKHCDKINYGPSLKTDNVSKFKKSMGGIPVLAEGHIVLSKPLFALFKRARKKLIAKTF